MLTSNQKVMLKRKHVWRDWVIECIEVFIVCLCFLALMVLNDHTLDNLLK